MNEAPQVSKRCSIRRLINLERAASPSSSESSLAGPLKDPLYERIIYRISSERSAAIRKRVGVCLFLMKGFRIQLADST